MVGKFTVCDSREIRWLSIAIIIIFFSRTAFSQTDSTKILAPHGDAIYGVSTELFDPSLISSETFLGTDESVFAEELQFITDDIERIAMHPLKLGQATWQDLQRIPTLNGLDMFEIMQSRQNNIPLRLDIANKFKSFMRTPYETETNVSVRSRVVLDPQAQDQSVYQKGTYHGSAIKTSSRFIAKTDAILFSMTEAKDAGEPLYFDHLTGCAAIYKPISVTDNISIKQCVLGDYSLSFGQGLLFNSGYSAMPLRDVNASIEPHTTGIQPYISSSSFRFFRGAASQISSGIYSASGFFSDRKIDATVNADTITSLYSNGYHRTTSEISRRDQAESRVAGGHIAITPMTEDSYLEFGATGYALNYDKPVMAKDSASFGFHGQRHAMFSADTRGIFSFITWNAEYAQMNSDAGKANAFALSAIIAPVTFLELSMNYHDLPQNFISPFGGTFGINSGTAQNERGFYFGSKLTILTNKLSFFSSANISESTKTDSIIRYTDFRFGASYYFHAFPLRLTALVRSFSKGKIFQISDDSLSKNSFRFDAAMNLSEKMSIAARAEFQKYYSDTVLGYLTGVQWNYAALSDLSFTSGIFYFNAATYASRFYSNESDLPGLASFISLYGTGYRYYIGASYTHGAVSISGRLGETRYSYKSGTMQSKAIAGVQCDIVF